MAEQLRYGPVARRALRSLVRSLPLLAFVAACVPDDAPPRSDSSATPVLSPAPAARVDSTPATAPASTPPPPAETTLPDVVTPDSLLPKPSYAGLPGWFVAGGRGLPRHIGVPTDTDSRAYTGILIDSGIVVFPDDAAWHRVGMRTPLTFVDDSGARSIRVEAAEADRGTLGVLLRIRTERAADALHLRMGWLVPERVRGVTALPMSETTAPDSSSRTWIAGDVRLRLRITGRRTAEFWAEREGIASRRVLRVGINAEADSSMGIDTDSLLTLSNWRMPSVVQPFRFGEDGPVAVVFHVSGYECSNYPLIVFWKSRIEVLDERHYYECQQ